MMDVGNECQGDLHVWVWDDPENIQTTAPKGTPCLCGKKLSEGPRSIDYQCDNCLKPWDSAGHRYGGGLWHCSNPRTRSRG